MSIFALNVVLVLMVSVVCGWYKRGSFYTFVLLDVLDNTGLLLARWLCAKNQRPTLTCIQLLVPHWLMQTDRKFCLQMTLRNNVSY